MNAQKSLGLPLIVFSQFAGTSLWFAGNAVIKDMGVNGDPALITSFVQFGFIAGTLVFALVSLADRYPAPRIFFFSSMAGALANLVLVWTATDLASLLTLRFLTGFFLAGIYPVGMKIAADWFPKRLGNALGFLVGALVLGTAFPHILRAQLRSFSWQQVIVFTSALAALGGWLVLLFSGPSEKRQATAFRWDAAFTIFRSSSFRSAAFGYFGHMWELYSFWAFVPALITLFNQLHKKELDVSFWSFLIIASGSLGCVAGGLISKKWGSRKVAFYALLVSGSCCLASPFIFGAGSTVFILALLVWGVTVVADSPQFSTLVAQSAPQENRGTALTIVTSIGFFITILSLQALRPMFEAFGQYSLLVLFAGPAAGLYFLKRKSA